MLDDQLKTGDQEGSVEYVGQDVEEEHGPREEGEQRRPPTAVP